MPKEYPRSSRVADALQRELSELIRREIKDPRLNTMTTITAVEVAPDLTSAKIYLSFLQKENDLSLSIICQSAGFLRRELGKVMRMRRVPELRFVLDDTLERGMHLTSLIAQARAKDQVQLPDESEDAER